MISWTSLSSYLAFAVYDKHIAKHDDKITMMMMFVSLCSLLLVWLLIYIAQRGEAYALFFSSVVVRYDKTSSNYFKVPGLLSRSCSYASTFTEVVLSRVRITSSA